MNETDPSMSRGSSHLGTEKNVHSRSGQLLMKFLKWYFVGTAALFWVLTPYAAYTRDVSGVITILNMAIGMSIAAFIFSRISNDRPWSNKLLIALSIGVLISFGSAWNTFEERRDHQARGRAWVLECINSGSERDCDLSKGVCTMAEDLGYEPIEECSQLSF